MTDASGRYVCTFNGEIYNYLELKQELQQLGGRFRSQSDTEVLLEAYARWGHHCLPRLNGMFAFAIYDRTARVLFCARDRLGVKPFVYTSTSRHFAFASEHKALRAAGLISDTLSPEAIYEFVARGYLTDGRSFYEGVRALEPGHALTVGPTGRERTWRWWEPPTEPERSKKADDWVDAVRDALDDAVRLRLRSDVPLGAHLSGGLDSSSIVASAACMGRTDIPAFTGAFAGFEGTDERQFSGAVNRTYGLVGVEIDIDLDDLSQVFDRVIWHMDEPLAGPGVLPQQLVYDATAAHGVKVVLGGQGGDELFGGYLRHRVLHFKRALAQGSLRGRSKAAAELVHLAFAARRRLRHTATRVSDAALAPEFLASIDPSFRHEVRRSPLKLSSARELMRWDLQHYLPALLHVDDRTSMAASIESRAPLLDYRLVELVMAIPDEHHFDSDTNKPLLRKVSAPRLPVSVAKRRDKQGFPTPLQHWRTQPQLRELVYDLTRRDGELSGARRKTETGSPTIFSRGFLARPHAMTANQLWTVMMVQGWLRQLREPSYRATSPPVPGSTDQVATRRAAERND